MGQLEKYGLYVLCLVIFLILGVTLWGGGEVPPTPRRSTTVQQEAPATGKPGPTLAALSGLPNGGRGDVKKDEPKKDEPKAGEAGKTAGPTGGKPAEASGGQGAAKPVEAPATRPTHKVQSGDSFESIARKAFGSAALRTEIQRLNPKVEPTRMKLGTELLLPTKAEAEQFLNGGTKAAATPPASGAAAKEPAKETTAPAPVETPNVGSRTYTVAKGDTFEGIATRQLGSARRTEELMALNPTIAPSALRIGHKLKLPKK